MFLSSKIQRHLFKILPATVKYALRTRFKTYFPKRHYPF